MFNLTHPLPKKYWVAVSGGVDSMAALHWLYKPSRVDSLLGVVYVNHNTPYADEAEEFVKSHCNNLGIKCLALAVDGYPPPGESKEAWWRDQRYLLFNTKVPGDEAIILAHHFDDCLEEYIMNVTIRGYMDTIKYRNGRCERPFRLWKKKDIREYAERNNVKYIEDPSNVDIRFKRNYIRKYVIQHILHLNPGIYNIVRRCVDTGAERF